MKKPNPINKAAMLAIYAPKRHKTLSGEFFDVAERCGALGSIMSEYEDGRVCGFEDAVEVVAEQIFVELGDLVEQTRKFKHERVATRLALVKTEVVA